MNSGNQTGTGSLRHCIENLLELVRIAIGAFGQRRFVLPWLAGKSWRVSRLPAQKGPSFAGKDYGAQGPSSVAGSLTASMMRRPR